MSKMRIQKVSKYQKIGKKLKIIIKYNYKELVNKFRTFLSTRSRQIHLSTQNLKRKYKIIIKLNYWTYKNFRISKLRIHKMSKYPKIENKLQNNN